jgi:hypothetical protein
MAANIATTNTPERTAFLRVREMWNREPLRHFGLNSRAHPDLIRVIADQNPLKPFLPFLLHLGPSRFCDSGQFLSPSFRHYVRIWITRYRHRMAICEESITLCRQSLDLDLYLRRLLYVPGVHCGLSMLFVNALEYLVVVSRKFLTSGPDWFMMPPTSSHCIAARRSAGLPSRRMSVSLVIL